MNLPVELSFPYPRLPRLIDFLVGVLNEVDRLLDGWIASLVSLQIGADALAVENVTAREDEQACDFQWLR